MILRCVRAVGSREVCEKLDPFTKNQSLGSARSRRTANQFRTNQSNFRHISVDLSRQNRALSPFAAQLKNNDQIHSWWNCGNSIAVMFELRCSEFELGCSESAGQPPTYQTSCAPWRPTEHENWIQREKGHP